MEEVIKKKFEPGTYTVAHQGIYTYIHYKVDEVPCVYEIPDGSDAHIEIRDGVCQVLESMESCLEQCGFKDIYRAEPDEIEEGKYNVYCAEYTPKECSKFTLKNVCLALLCDNDGRPYESILVTIDFKD